MNRKSLTIERVAFALVFLLAAGLRTLNLGGLNLTNFEAAHALEALSIARGGAVVSGADPLYTLLTSLVFFLLGDSNALARLLPALAGASLVLIPFALRRQVGVLPALILALGLAFDPVLVAQARLASGLILGLAMTAWAWVAWRKGQPVAAGLLAGLALLGAQHILFGLVSLALAGLVWRILQPGMSLRILLNTERQFSAGGVQRAFVVAGLTFFMAGTLGGWIPSGLGGAASSLAGEVQRWLTIGDLTPLQFLLSILIYQPLALGFAIVGSVRAVREAEPAGRFIAFWLVISLLVGLILPGRQPMELAWLSLPLWIVAGREIARHLTLAREERLSSLMQAGLVLLLAFVTWVNLASLLASGDPQALTLRWVLVASIVGVGILATVLVGLGWSRQVAVSGLTIGLLASFGLLAVGESLSTARYRPHTADDLWQSGPTVRDAGLLLETLEDLSEWRTGRRDSLDVTLLHPDATLQWLVRHFPAAVSVDALGANSLPSAIIAPVAEPEPALSIAYRGQVFDWEQRREWAEPLPGDWLRWLLFRNSPATREQLTLWVRSDVFPAGEIVMQDTGGVESQLEDIFDEDAPLR
jgi:hypothetical protein